MKKFTNFSFHLYTEIVFGKGTETQVAALIKKHGGTKVMLVYGGGSIKKIGLYDTVVKTLNAASIPFVELGGVQPNPRRSLVDKGLKLAHEEGVDFFLGVGGGSAIDTAKGIALGMANDDNYWQFYSGVEPKKMAPVGTIHTISAAGSETSTSSVLLDDIDTHRKYGFAWEACRPVFAIMNPELTYTVSKYQTGVGATDIFAHTFMRYFINFDSALGDEYCEGTLRTVVKYAGIACENPNDYEARAELMLAGSFGHNDLTGIGRSGRARGGEHGLESQLSGIYDTSHGAGLAVVMPALLEYFVKHGDEKQVARTAQFAVKVFGADPNMGDAKSIGAEGVARLRAWLKGIGMPLTLKELGVPKEDLQSVIDNCRCNADGILVGYMDLDKKAVAEIFTSVVE